MIPFSVLDLSPIIEGKSAADAFRNTLDLARHAERWGYHRYWMAEHHNMPGIASAATAVVIAHVAGGTERIRVGSGGVMRGEGKGREAGRGDVDPQFFLQFARERHLGRLAGIDLAAGKFPQSSHGFSRWPLRQEHPAVIVDQGRSSDQDAAHGLRGGCAPPRRGVARTARHRPDVNSGSCR